MLTELVIIDERARFQGGTLIPEGAFLKFNPSSNTFFVQPPRCRFGPDARMIEAFELRDAWGIPQHGYVRVEIVHPNWIPSREGFVADGTKEVMP